MLRSLTFRLLRRLIRGLFDFRLSRAGAHEVHVMSCLSCRSSKQAEFPAELLVHFEGRENLDKPGVWVFPRLLVCLDCGFLQSTVPAPQLASLVAGSPDSERAVGRMFDDKLFPAN